MSENKQARGGAGMSGNRAKLAGVKIRLTSAERWPHHGTVPNGPTEEEQDSAWERHARNAPIIVGAPVEPIKSEWRCGTDVVWPVLEYRGQKFNGEYFVCRHQIEAGD